MKYLRGYLTAGIFGAITWVLMAYGQRFSTLVDMVYPYVTRNLQDILAQWSSQVDFCLWQLLAVALGVLLLCSVVLMIVLKWNVVQWLGWVLAVFIPQGDQHLPAGFELFRQSFHVLSVHGFTAFV